METQREISRALVPQVEASMQPAYASATDERGTGSFMRMKTIMTNHVEQRRHEMFEDAVDIVLHPAPWRSVGQHPLQACGRAERHH
ncbi:hypothetical protein DFJ74DRAFT_206630 [Hyaloraphidium curvatum]|nr:hypothetical protein DFJ74DRAFT_206630 [Hyaloraphidium curvatum]